MLHRWSRWRWTALALGLVLAIALAVVVGSRLLASPPVAESAAAASERILRSKTLVQIFRDGGVLMIPIAACSFVLTVFVLERLISLRKGHIIPGPFVKRFLDQLRDGELTRDTAWELCEQNDSPVARLFAAGVRKWNKSSVEVEQAILDEGERIGSQLRRYLRLINGVSTVCPLLGLLGTVLGMIQAFDAIAGTAADSGGKALIALGISQAMLTTAAGLSVAIPALGFYLYFCGLVDRRIMEIDALGMEVVHCISAEALAENAGGRAGGKARGRPQRPAA